MRYLTGSIKTKYNARAREWGLGLMAQPGNSYHLHLEHWPWWAADNGCYAASRKPGGFDPAAWWAWLVQLPRTCLFACSPDVLNWVTVNGEEVCVGDAAKTLAQAEEYLPRIRHAGFRAALVAQDGLEQLPVPWSTFDALFVGGSTGWKASEAAYQLAGEARARGKHTHMGRVNTRRRIMAAAASGVYDSCDGTKLAYGEDRNLPELLRWLAEVEYQPGLWRSSRPMVERGATPL